VATVVMKSRPFHRPAPGTGGPTGSGRGKDNGSTVFRGAVGGHRGMPQVRGDEVVVEVV